MLIGCLRSTTVLAQVDSAYCVGDVDVANSSLCAGKDLCRGGNRGKILFAKLAFNFVQKSKARFLDVGSEAINRDELVAIVIS